MSVCMGAQRKERGNGKSEKWNKMEEEGDREGEQREKGTEREMYSLFSLPPFFLHVHYSVFSASTRFFGEAADRGCRLLRYCNIYNVQTTEDNDSPHLSHTILTHYHSIKNEERRLCQILHSAFPGHLSECHCR